MRVIPIHPMATNVACRKRMMDLNLKGLEAGTAKSRGKGALQPFVRGKRAKRRRLGEQRRPCLVVQAFPCLRSSVNNECEQPLSRCARLLRKIACFSHTRSVSERTDPCTGLLSKRFISVPEKSEGGRACARWSGDGLHATQERQPAIQGMGATCCLPQRRGGVPARLCVAQANRTRNVSD